MARAAFRTAGPLLVTKDEIIQFAKQYDPVPRHLDEEAAARSVFGGLTASSAHTFSISILLASKEPAYRLHETGTKSAVVMHFPILRDRNLSKNFAGPARRRPPTA